ncbi:MAG: hypothetical protein ACFFCW_49490 [Candidatus Hodarchaeota archaeon]
MIKYAHKESLEVLTLVRQKHKKNSEATLKINKIHKRMEILLGSSRLHILLLIIGLLIYYLISYSSLHPFGVGPTEIIPVPIINGFWGATVIASFTLTVIAEFFLLGFKIEGDSIDVYNKDKTGGYKEVVDTLTKLLVVIILGVGFYFLSFYIFVSYNALIIGITMCSMILFGLYFFIIYRLHYSLKNEKKLRLKERREKEDQLEKKLEESLEHDKYEESMKIWLALQLYRNSLSSNRLKELRTWPLSLPNIGKISIATIASFSSSLVVKIITEIFF